MKIYTHPEAVQIALAILQSNQQVVVGNRGSNKEEEAKKAAKLDATYFRELLLGLTEDQSQSGTDR